MTGFDEGFDNYGLRVVITADYEYENKAIRSQHVTVASDPSVENLAEMMIGLIESCYGWEASREEIKVRLIRAILEAE